MLFLNETASNSKLFLLFSLKKSLNSFIESLLNLMSFVSDPRLLTSAKLEDNKRFTSENQEKRIEI